ncbi:MAG: hypothetical protein MJE68_02805 [Proteobacteria bacterium]|nr:hypothetical protein [Pseudomonadota bacterium]
MLGRPANQRAPFPSRGWRYGVGGVASQKEKYKRPRQTRVGSERHWSPKKTGALTAEQKRNTPTPAMSGRRGRSSKNRVDDVEPEGPACQM